MIGNGDAQLILLVAAGIFIYLLPSITAAARQHRNLASLVVINLLLGWTLLGWAICMAWSVAAAPQVDVNLRERIGPPELPRHRRRRR